MPKISACIISLNEEKNIEACIRSLQAVADEIVIVDSLSTDKTLEIAKKYTDKIIHQAFLGHVEQKSLAVSEASYDWILSLDCDEQLDEQLAENILALKDSLDDADAYCMARKTFYIYRWLNHCWYPDKKVRLFNRKTAKWGGTNPHDKVEVAGNHIVMLKGDILHYSFNSISEHIRTLDSFTEIGAREILRKGKRVSLASPFTHGFWTFFRLYFLRRGFMDGFAGIVVGILSGVHAFVKYSKVIMMRKQDAKKN